MTRMCVHLSAMIILMSAAVLNAGVITAVSIPVGSSNGPSHPLSDSVYSVTESAGVLPITSGIGYLVNPATGSPGSAENSADFAIHTIGGFLSSNTPDPNVSFVTYQFDSPTIVSGLEVVQHINGITKVEALYGNSLGSLISLGSVSAPSGSFTEHESTVFDFANSTLSGTYFQFKILETVNPAAFAIYRAMPLDTSSGRILAAGAAAAVPEPASGIALGIGSLVAFVLRRRQQKKLAAPPCL